MARLERELDLRLFVRTTRSLRLTGEGALYLPYAQDVLATLREGQARVQAEDAELHGTLQLSAPSDLGRNLLLPWLSAFRAAHPRLRLHLRLSDEVADVFRDPVDVAIRIGHFDDANYVALPLLEGNRRVLAASPDYLQRRGTPTRRKICVSTIAGLPAQRSCLRSLVIRRRRPPGGDTGARPAGLR